MAGKTKEEKFSAASLQVIRKTKTEFSPSIVKLANELCVATFHGAPPPHAKRYHQRSCGRRADHRDDARARRE